MRGISRAALATAIGIKKGAVERIEQGRSAPSLRRLIALADAIDVPLRDLFDFGQPGQPHGPELAAIVALVEKAAEDDPTFPARALAILRAAAHR